MKSFDDLNLIENSYWSPIHLQWFAAEDEGRTEEPSETKIRKAREDGKVAKSVDLVSAAVLFFPFATVVILAGYIWNTCLEMMHYFLSQAVVLDPVTSGGVITTTFYVYLGKMILPVLAVAFVAAIAANVLQFGFIFTLKPITPDFKKIIPKFGPWLKNSLFSPQALFNIVKQIVKIVVLVAISWMNIQSQWMTLVNLIHASFSFAITTLGQIITNIVLESAVVLIVLAIPDFLFQRHQHKESLKMSKQEMKEEHKQQEGDPLIRSRLRERMREILRQNMMKNVPKADVVITNPTHFAIALQYNNTTMTAPTVVAKGQDLIAQRIKEIAKDNGVPMVENRPLARALFAAVEIGDQIPQEYWEIVSRILAQVYKMSGKDQAVVG